MKTVNGKLAVTRFPDMAVKTEAKGTGIVKVGVIENKINLVPLTVVFADEKGEYREGDIVYVRGSLFASQWAREAYTLDGKEFILMPAASVDVLQRSAPPSPSYPPRPTKPTLNDLF